MKGLKLFIIFNTVLFLTISCIMSSPSDQIGHWRLFPSCIQYPNLCLSKYASLQTFFFSNLFLSKTFNLPEIKFFRVQNYFCHEVFFPFIYIPPFVIILYSLSFIARIVVTFHLHIVLLLHYIVLLLFGCY